MLACKGLQCLKRPQGLRTFQKGGVYAGFATPRLDCRQRRRLCAKVRHLCEVDALAVGSAARPEACASQGKDATVFAEADRDIADLVELPEPVLIRYPTRDARAWTTRCGHVVLGTLAERRLPAVEAEGG